MTNARDNAERIQVFGTSGATPANPTSNFNPDALAKMSPDERLRAYGDADRRAASMQRRVADKLKPKLTASESELALLQERRADKAANGQPSGIYDERIKALKTQVVAEARRDSYLSENESKTERLTVLRNQLVERNPTPEMMDAFDVEMQTYLTDPSDERFHDAIDAWSGASVDLNQRDEAQLAELQTEVDAKTDEAVASMHAAKAKRDELDAGRAALADQQGDGVTDED